MDPHLFATNVLSRSPAELRRREYVSILRSAESEKVSGPDFFVVLDVEERQRKSWAEGRAEQERQLANQAQQRAEGAEQLLAKCRQQLGKLD